MFKCRPRPNRRIYEHRKDKIYSTFLICQHTDKDKRIVITSQLVDETQCKKMMLMMTTTLIIRII